AALFPLGKEKEIGALAAPLFSLWGKRRRLGPKEIGAVLRNFSPHPVLLRPNSSPLPLSTSGDGRRSTATSGEAKKKVYARSIKRSSQSHQISSKLTADHESNEDGERREIASCAGCHYSNASL